MSRGIAVLSSLGVGAGLMFLFDPTGGSRRRQAVKDTTGWLWQWLGRGSDASAEDRALTHWVRAKMSRAVGHPEDVEADVHLGRVVLSGRLPAREVDALLSAVWSARGVRDVENQLLLYHDGLGVIPEAPSRVWSLEVGHA